MLACDKRQLVELLDTGDISMLTTFARQMTGYLKLYYYVGGMPECVNTYIETDNMQEVRRIQENLLLYYENDFSKHALPVQIPRIQMVWNSIPAQLAKENRKFIYGVLREGARAKDYEIAIQWLNDYGLIHKSTRIKKPALPLISYTELSSFKMYMLDVGLLCAKGRLSEKTIVEGNRIFEEFKGALTEQYIAQEIAALGMEMYYYSTENSSGEIDFVLQKGDLCIPVEVKASENLKAQSLRAYCAKYHPETAIRTSLSGYREESWMTNVPLYMFSSYIQNRYV